MAPLVSQIIRESIHTLINWPSILASQRGTPSWPMMGVLLDHLLRILLLRVRQKINNNQPGRPPWPPQQWRCWDWWWLASHIIGRYHDRWVWLKQRRGGGKENSTIPPAIEWLEKSIKNTTISHQNRQRRVGAIVCWKTTQEFWGWQDEATESVCF